MRNPVSEAYFKRLLNAIKATHFLIEYYVDLGEQTEIGKLGLQLRELSLELNNSYIEEY